MYALLVLCFFLYFPNVLVGKLASKETNNRILVFKYSLYGALLSVGIGLVLVLVNKATFSFDFVTLSTALLFGVMMSVCQIATLYALQVTSVAISNMSATVSIIIPCFVGMFFFNEAITAGKIIGIFVFFIAAYLIITQNGEEKRSFTMKSLIACLLIFLTSGFGSISMQLFSNYSKGISDSLFMLYSYIFNAMILFAFILLLKKKQNVNEDVKTTVLSKKLLGLGLVKSMTLFFIQQTNVVLANQIPAAVLFPVLNSGSLIMGVIAGWLVFKEKLSAKNIIGIILAIGALVLLNF